MIKTLVFGPNGKMGKAIIQLAQGHPMITIVGGIGPKGRNYINKGQIFVIDNYDIMHLEKFMTRPLKIEYPAAWASVESAQGAGKGVTAPPSDL
jgi:dihydrodipicolinate reductase